MRADLHALDDDALAALANRGIVKRAARELAEGKAPVLGGEGDTVVGTFDDGTRVELPVGVTLEAARCSCPASGVCRHKVIVVLAFQRTADQDGTGTPAALAPWSPGGFTDTDLERVLGARIVGVARKVHRGGYRARVRRPSADDPVPTVELPSCTVRFLVPHELGYARADAVALAVWAFREADTRDPDAPTVDLMIGGDPPAVAAESGIEPALALLAEVLADGVSHLGPSPASTLSVVRRALDAANLRWPVDALDDLTDQIEAYGARSGRYAAEDVAAVLAELVARHRCVAGGGASLRSDVLGTEESAETPLRLLRLTGLGARVTGDDTSRVLEVYLAHPGAGVVLALRRRVEAADGETAPSGEEMARRKTGGARLSVVAAGNVVTESAVRAANRVVRIAESRVARTTASVSAGDWGGLPPGVLVTDLDAERARLAGLAPAVVRPRLVAENVRAVQVEEIRDVAWLPGEQRLLATVQAPSGLALLSLEHSATAPGAIDALASALAQDVGFVAGHLRRHAGRIIIEPTAVVVAGTVIVPAFASASAEAVSAGAALDDDPLADALREALALSAEIVHRGWRRLSPSWAPRAERSADRLRTLGMQALAGTTTNLVTGVRSVQDPVAALDSWADHHVRLLVTAEQL